MPLLAQFVVEYVIDASALEAGATAAAQAMVDVGESAAASSAYLDSLGEAAFSCGVGFDGMAASADMVMGSSDALATSVEGIDGILAQTSASADSAALSLQGVADIQAEVTAASDGAAVSLASVADASDVAAVGLSDFNSVVDTASMTTSEYIAYISGASMEMGIFADASDVAAVSTGTLTASLQGVAVSGSEASGSLDLVALSEDAVEASSDAAKSALAGMGIALAAVGIAAVVGGALAVKSAGDFQSAISRLVTGAGESEANIKMVSDGILAMAPDVGQTTKQLTDGMYMIESAGYHGAEGLKVLKAAAEGAKVGNADLGTVANGVTTIMTDFASQNITASQATNTLVAAVANGKTTMQDLSTALSGVLPTASAAGVGLTDVMSAMSTMTGEGVTAANAATYLRQTIMAIENPTKKAATEMASLGLKSADVAAEMKVSLPGALQMITDAAGKKFPVGSSDYVAAIANMVGGTKSLQGILDLAGDHIDTFKNNVLNIQDAVNKGGSSINGWAKVQGDFNQKMSEAGAALETMGIKIGTPLLPLLGKMLDGFSSPGFSKFADTTGKNIAKIISDIGDFVTPLVPKFLDFAKNVEKAGEAFNNPAFKKLATEIGGDLLNGIRNLVNALSSPQFGTFMKLVGEGIAGAILFVIPLVLEITKNIVKFAEDITSRVQPQINSFMKWWNTNWPAIASLLQGVWDNIKGIVKIAWSLISGWIKVGLDLLNGDWGKAWNDMKDMLKGVWDGIKTSLKGDLKIIEGIFGISFSGLEKNAFNFGVNIVKQIADGIRGAIHLVGDAIHDVTQFIADHLPHSPAKMGPLMTLQEQGQEITNQISKGMINGVPTLTSALDNLLKPVALSVKAPSLVAAGSIGSASTSPTSSNTPTVIVHNHNHNYIDGKEITNNTMNRVMKELRGHGLKA